MNRITKKTLENLVDVINMRLNQYQPQDIRGRYFLDWDNGTVKLMLLANKDGIIPVSLSYCKTKRDLYIFLQGFITGNLKSR
jgi:hypothetical protein